MGVDQTIVTVAGIALIGFIFWFFFMKKESAVTASKSVDVIVDGGYSPQVIRTEAGKELTITFVRKDPSPCLEDVVLSDFGIRRYLPLNESVKIAVTPKEKGEYGFACGMNMFHGKIIAA